MSINTKFVDHRPYTYSTLRDRYHRFTMAQNQRPYAWRSSQIDELWTAIIENEAGYYIGNLVCLNPEDGYSALVIVDGQQRITTISLLLIALKDVLTNSKDFSSNPKYKEFINLIDDSLYWRNPRTLALSPVLIPGKENLITAYNSLLNGDVENKNVDGNQSKYFSNFKFVLSTVKKELVNKKESEIDKLLNKILSVQFIAIVVQSEDDIFDLFEGLNSTGLGLTVADLLKNSVLRSATTQKSKDNIESNWLELEKLFESTETGLFPRFIRHYWISKNGLISNSVLYKTIRTNKITNKSSEDVELFTKELLENAQIYIGLRFEEFESNLALIRKEEKLKEKVALFKYIRGIDQVFEVLLALYNKKTSDSDYKPSMFSQDVDRLLNFTILTRYVNINPSDYEKEFANICQVAQKSTGTEYESQVGPIFKKLFNLVNKREEFANNFSTNLEHGSGSKLIKYLIPKLMRVYSTKDASITVYNPEIEHILPQSPIKWGLTKEQISKYVHKIGNLTILFEGDNKEAENETLDIKIDRVYCSDKSKFQFNKDIKNYRDQFIKNPAAAIQARGIELGNLAFDFLKIL